MSSATQSMGPPAAQSIGLWQKMKPILIAPFYAQDLRSKQIKYIALASLGLGLSVAACCVCPPLAVVLSIAAGAASVWCSSSNFLDNTHARNQLTFTIKSIAFKVLGVFSKKYRNLSQELASQAPFFHNVGTTKKVINIALSVIAIGLWAASYFVAPQLGLIFNAVYAGIALVQWVDYSRDLCHYYKSPEPAQTV